MEISIENLEICFPKVSAHLYKIPYLKVLKNKKNHSSKGGSPASSFLTLFRGGP